MNLDQVLIPASVLMVFIAIVLVGFIYAKNYVKVPPNMVAVFTGRGKQKVVRGGARFRVPILERVDFMALTPFNVEARVSDVYSTNGVPVNVTAIALVRFGSTDDMIATAVERFLTSNREEMLNQVREIIAGNMRAIVSQMTIEQLNSSRDELTRRVKEEAESAFTPIGMQLDVLTIQNISDNNGYLDALGSKRIAEVKRDAAVGQAEAERETRISTAAADQAASEAEAVAATRVAEANQQRDTRLAELKALTDAEQARANQAGPLAEAEALAKVEVARAEADRQREEAQIQVEAQRALRAAEAAKANTIVPAEAARQAAILEAEGQKQATIARAEADAEERKLAGDADAQARTRLADAMRVEMEAEAAGEAAKLKAQAEGTRELAEAQNTFTESAQRLQVLPHLISIIPDVAKAIAEGVQIDNMVVMDNGSGDGSNSAFTRAASTVPTGLFQLTQSLGALGIDLPSLLGGVLSPSVPQPTESESSDAVA